MYKRPFVTVALVHLAVLGALLLIGCSTSEPTAVPTAPPTQGAPTEAPTVAPSPMAGPKRGGELRVSLEEDMTNTDPHFEQAYFGLVVFEQVYEGLLTRGYDMTLQPGLAESWEMPDPQTYIFHLRQGVKFHNGREMVADDVVYSLNRIRDPDVGSPWGGWLVSIEEIQATDDYTVEVKLSRPDATLLNTLAWRYFAIVPQEVVEENGGMLSGVMVGTGPFKLAEWQPKVHIKLERNPDYWREGLPYLDAITFVPIPDNTARTTALRTGTVDFSDNVPGQDVETIEAMEDVTTVERVATAYMFLGMNTAQPPFDDVRVRQAVAYAVDRQAYVDTVLFGYGRVMDGGPIPDSNWAYADLHTYAERDLEKAKELLADAGYPDGLDTTIKLVAGGPLDEGLGQIAQANLAEIGINAELVPLEFGVLIEQFAINRDFEMVVMGFSDFWEPNDFLYPVFHTGEGFNPWGYSNPEVDSLLEQAREELDQDKRAELYTEAQRIIVEEAPLANFAQQVIVQAYYDYVQGFQPMADGGKLSFVETWLDK
jgi:peptide/nickel transport system substrate-binding protein